MNRNSTLIGLSCLVAVFQYNSLSATIYNDNGTATTYTLVAGDSLHIASGTYTGTIASFATGAKISVAHGATFQPAAMSFPNVRGTIYVYGTFKMTTQLRTNSDFRIHNYGLVWVTSTTLMSGSGQQWTNYFGATMNLDGNVSMTNDNSIYNQGSINCGADLTMTGATSLTNRLFVTINGNYLNNGGILTNLGRFYTKGSITFNNGLAMIYNYCRMIAETGIYNTTGHLYNYGFVWSKSSPGTGVLVNSGNIINGPGAVILAISLNNTGTITGSGYLYFTGTTTTTNSGTTGVNGVTSDTIRMYDASRANLATIYDNQTGTVHPNVIFSQYTALDSNRAYLGQCSIEMVSQIPLAVNWQHFFVSLDDRTPVLDWSAKTDAGTRFEVQRSYDGRNFNSIHTITTEDANPAFHYVDAGVNSKASVVYYRILAVETTGAQKYSETRTVKFSNENGISIQIMPNPFTTQFTIGYQAKEATILTIKVFSMTGQQQLARTVNLNSGYNNISVTEAARLPKGMYLVQVSEGSNILSAEKIVKQ